MPSFNHNPIGIHKLCDQYLNVLYDKQSATVFSGYNTILFQGWSKLLAPNSGISPSAQNITHPFQPNLILPQPLLMITIFQALVQ